LKVLQQAKRTEALRRIQELEEKIEANEAKMCVLSGVARVGFFAQYDVSMMVVETSALPSVHSAACRRVHGHDGGNLCPTVEAVP
jgi:hypothetical protein